MKLLIERFNKWRKERRARDLKRKKNRLGGPLGWEPAIVLTSPFLNLLDKNTTP